MLNWRKLMIIMIISLTQSRAGDNAFHFFGFWNPHYETYYFLPHLTWHLHHCGNALEEYLRKGYFRKMLNLSYLGQDTVTSPALAGISDQHRALPHQGDPCTQGEAARHSSSPLRFKVGSILAFRASLREGRQACKASKSQATEARACQCQQCPEARLKPHQLNDWLDNNHKW